MATTFFYEVHIKVVGHGDVTALYNWQNKDEALKWAWENMEHFRQYYHLDHDDIYFTVQKKQVDVVEVDDVDSFDE